MYGKIADEEQKPIGFIALAEEPGGEKTLMRKKMLYNQLKDGTETYWWA